MAFSQASIALVLATLWACASAAEYDRETPSAAIYPAAPSDCYILLRSDGRRVSSSDVPMCQAVVRNLNRFCSQGPLYNRRLLHSSTTDLAEPSWQEINAGGQVGLLENIYSMLYPERIRATRWAQNRERILELANDGILKISRSRIEDAGPLSFGTADVYMMENITPSNEPGYNQPILMFAEPGETTPSLRFKSLYFTANSDIWSFDGNWLLVTYAPSLRRFLVRSLERPTRTDVFGITRCTIENVRKH